MAAAKQTLALIGAGRMGSALVRGWVKGKARQALHVVAPRPSAEMKALAADGKITLNPKPAPVSILVIALKPQVFSRAVHDLRDYVGPNTLVISVMAGIRLNQLADKLGASRVVRAMPNTPGAIGKGVTLLTALPDAAKTDIETARKLLKPLGHVEGPIEERLFAAAMAISGCGPAYVFLLAEVMAMAGESEGLPKELAERIARYTVEGAAALMESTGEAPNDLRRAVTSPGGVTQAALDVLMDDGGLPSLMRTAQRAAARRDSALARESD